MRLLPLLAGAVLLAAYASLARHVGFVAELGRDFVYVGWREALFWIAHATLATPGVLLLAWGAAPALGPILLRAWRGLRDGPATRRRLAVALFFLALLTAAVAGRARLLLDMPLTDDENSVAFAGRIVAEGRLMAPAPQPMRAFPLLFVYQRDGLITSLDYPGGILTAALAQASGLGSVLYALIAALAGLALLDAGRSLAGRDGAITAALLWLLSPMVLALSLTNHSILVSRTAVAVAVAAWARLVVARDDDASGTLVRGTVPAAVLGLAAGVAFLCRPFESACLLTPIAFDLAWHAWRGATTRRPEHRRALLLAVLGWLPSVAVFAWYNAGTTGRWFLPARFAGPEAEAHAWRLADLWQRLGTNLGFNLMMLAVWLLGPLGAAAIAAGVGGLGGHLGGRGHAARTLGAGVGLALLLALAHDDTGIHAVGPIHYANAAPHLILLATFGLIRLRRWLAEARIPPSVPAALALGAAASLALFSAGYAPTLRAQAEILRLPLDAVARAGIHHAVVVADPQHRLWDLRPELREVRSWTIQLPPPDPFLRDDVIFVYPSVPGRALAARFPDRAFYRMTYAAEGEPIVLERLMPAGGR